MSYSLLSVAGDTKNGALKGLRDAATAETNRENANKELKSAHKQQTMSSVGSGAAIGTMINPGLGTAAGAAAGLVLGELF
ncbi:bacteriocin [Vibrio quintilis]|uniref:Bacteriocin n=1 Tax=Vibrio quintilis TaxID=1117707 RepID=A0A1M7YP63_9VIBR|nr:bacteriocin [Vibrio quintilis]SHO54418.1 hypothetical protein VQ7734_00132 [Vibrio quintilis]